MADIAHLTVSDDLDTIRRSVAPDLDLEPGLTRFLAACAGTLRGIEQNGTTSGASRHDGDEGDPR
ncbi:hypothetical protein [Mobilicoccus pelagius]|uniref:Uncharacterized protein n=1 Tax=Mobilicoccus pelagius NBRC 104925 TaxID=1089455 RepID=H5USS5_9MICO|nr:hypothetical protein [Mobilicoccus pelagius]GAB48783.1 hypothetical protein MOPEL_080_00620 [Mobilicoccus pelagius NBRC 104925]